MNTNINRAVAVVLVLFAISYTVIVLWGWLAA